MQTQKKAPAVTEATFQNVQSDYNTKALCSGYGQYHSPKAERNPKPYITTTLDQIDDSLRDPPDVEKSKAQWCIFSTCLSRGHAEQRHNGQYYALWADIDEAQGKRLKETFSLALCAVPYDMQAYTSKSATLENQKARLIIPLGEPVNGETYSIMQRVLNNKLSEQGLIPDRVTERTGQICYLPNKGEFYDFEINEFSGLLSSEYWHEEIQTERERLEAEKQALSRRRESARIKASQRMASGERSPIKAFNEAYELDLMLTTFGYMSKGSRFLSPLSSSGSPAVIIKDDKWISHHGNDIEAGIGQLSDDGASCFGDAFDLFKYYQHTNDENEAIKAAGDMFTTSEGVSITNQNQRDFMAKESQKETAEIFLNLPPTDDMQNPLEAPEKPKFDFKMFSLNGQSTEMRLQMLEDKFVLGRLAILGQATAFYAKPNSGKTLLTIWLLIEAIKEGEIKSDDVFYINADDNYKGLVTKLEIGEKYGFNMLAPSFNGFEASKFMDYLSQLILADDAKGKVLILDTLKKFTNIMDKKVASDFGVYMRGFVSKGGTIIMLAHTNKHRDEEGKVVFSGTSDIVDDVDCAYTIDVSENGNQESKTVIFENIKSRGDVSKEAVYSYLCKASDYQELIDSVKGVSDDDAEEAKRQKTINDKLNANRDGIEAILEAIDTGFTLKTELIENAYKSSGISKKKIAKILKEHTGNNYLDGHRWQEIKGDKNTKRYKAHFSSPPVKSYQEARDGIE
tara:strand:- start:4029 stop:6245 length:2217 start_codon:yes stop_codon:yes gene_type:complete